ncbi:MAG: bifunctional diguanylate cyclase/phosphodiesterase, partial [Kangiellaceae bacterium]|nr:bifunctional diguanylate cyclase/phosphodiesterase [Kangiellaceae bacterium]
IEQLYRDATTGLPNKVLAHDRLAHAIEHARTINSTVTVTSVAIDDFDFLNQNLDEKSINQILRQVTRRISRELADDDTLAYYSKNRFLIIFESSSGLDDEVFRLHKMLSQCASSQHSSSSGVPISISLGVASFPADATNVEKLIDRSHQALKSAFNQGKQSICYFNKNENKQASDKLSMKSALEFALENNQLFLVYQPKIELTTLKPVGFEVLVRWRTADGNIIYPSQFLDIAEQSGLIVPLTQWLLHQAFRTLRQWKQEGFNIAFAVNLIPRHCHQVGSPEHLTRLFKEYELVADDVHVEINEANLLDVTHSTYDFIEKLSQAGVNVTLDDFGKWQLPFNRIKSLPIYAAKIERNYVRSIGKDESNHAILQTMSFLLDKVGIKTTAKGIENEEQIKELKRIGCVYGQGYYFSDPLTESQARRYLLDGNF